MRKRPTKRALGVHRRRFRERFEGDAAKERDATRGVHDVRRLVGLSALRDRREIRAVRLHEDSVERCPLRNVLDGERSLERDDAREREIEAEVQGARRERAIFAEAMDDAADVGGTFAFEDLERVGRGATRVNHDRLLHVAREVNQARERLSLYVARRVVVVVVESDFADGDDLRLVRERFDFRIGGVVERDCVMRMNTERRACALRNTLRERDRCACRAEVGANADDDEASDACGICAREDFVRPIREVLWIEVAVRIDEHDDDTIS